MSDEIVIVLLIVFVFISYILYFKIKKKSKSIENFTTYNEYKAILREYVKGRKQKKLIRTYFDFNKNGEYIDKATIINHIKTMNDIYKEIK